MISIDTSFISTVKMTDPSVASACSLGFFGSELIASGLSGACAMRTGNLLGLPVRERDERPTKALEAEVAAAKAKAYAYAATGAETKKQTQHHTMWAFRRLEPWSDPA
ncbi:hypothetical protein [Streptomyces sp. NPDC051569]|uniref:hypothetical protein n=1 Tax=Streptomyces sp. NPDC051569 TaxID=3365661 RepID=UPI0037931C74